MEQCFFCSYSKMRWAPPEFELVLAAKLELLYSTTVALQACRREGEKKECEDAQGKLDRAEEQSRIRIIEPPVLQCYTGFLWWLS